MSKHEETTTPVDNVKDNDVRDNNISDHNTVNEAVNAENVAEAAVENMPPDSIPESSAPEAGTAPEPTEMESDPLKSQTEEYLALVQRTRAEFANYKKRTERELSEAKHRGALDALTSVLPIIDDFERAMENVPADLQGNPWVNGVTLLLRQFEKILSEHDVVAIAPTGENFDPNRHEAIGMEASDSVESGHVTVTLRKGYSSGDRVLRPALVKVAS